jgi:hypothetical protein
VLGYGAPVIGFAVRKFEPSTSAGCSVGPLADYVTVDFARADASTLAHEIGHACNLSHTEAGLMKGSAPRDAHLSDWQKIKFRASRHVTYL